MRIADQEIRSFTGHFGGKKYPPTPFLPTEGEVNHTVSEAEGVRTRKWKSISPDLETDPSGFTGPRAESQTRRQK